MKKMISILLAFCLALMPLYVSAATIEEIEDVPEKAWFHDAVAYCLEKGYMQGTGGGKFSPALPVSRAQIAQVIWNKEGCPSHGGLEFAFDDVGPYWYRDAILWCKQSGVITGTGPTTFAPEGLVTRQDICVMVYRYFTEYLHRTAALAPETYMAGYFRDWSTCAPYAREALRWAVRSGFMSGTAKDMLSPWEKANRAQLAQFLMNLDKVLAAPDPILEPETPYTMGVDISYHNGDVDFEPLKEQGIEFVIIRCGYGGDYPEQDDSLFEINVRKAEEAGMPWGCYLYSYAKDEEMAENESQHALRLLAGRVPEFGMWYDIEDPSQADKDLVAIGETFCDALHAAGVPCGIYSGLNWMNDKMDDPRLEKYDIWLAQWNVSCSYQKPYAIWQFTNQYVIGGKDFDGNAAYKTVFTVPVVEPEPDGGDDVKERLRLYKAPVYGLAPADEVDKAMGDGWK